MISFWLRKKVKESLDIVVVCCGDCGREIARFHIPHDGVADSQEDIDNALSLQLCSVCGDKERMRSALHDLDTLRSAFYIENKDGSVTDTYPDRDSFINEVEEKEFERLTLYYTILEIDYIDPKDLAVAEAMVKKLKAVK